MSPGDLLSESDLASRGYKPADLVAAGEAEPVGDQTPTAPAAKPSPSPSATPRTRGRPAKRKA